MWFGQLGAFLGALSHCTADNLIIWLHWQRELSAFLTQIFGACWHWYMRSRSSVEMVTQTLMNTNNQTWFCMYACTTLVHSEVRDLVWMWFLLQKNWDRPWTFPKAIRQSSYTHLERHDTRRITHRWDRQTLFATLHSVLTLGTC